MKIFNETIKEISKLLVKKNIEFVLTRFDCSKKSEPSDLDILVAPSSYHQFVAFCEDLGYQAFSHDRALGGRIKGMQVNLMKPRRTKIDLHKDFTWRRSRYFDLDLVWKNLRYKKLNGAKVALPLMDVDAFIVMVNVIFEKTYINKEDFNYLCSSSGKIFSKEDFSTQAERYYWNKTFIKFKSWFINIQDQNSFPVFLPVRLVLYSYLEKFLGEHKIDVISFMYYVFFRTRYQLKGVLPYE